MKFSLFPAVLFSIGWMSVVVTGDDHPPTCCLTVSDTRIPAENIVKYEMQEPTLLCTLRAVRFHTKKKIIICSDPDSKYAKRVMNIVDGRTTAKPTMCYTSTTNTIPAVTTIETSRPETEATMVGNGPPPTCCLTVTDTRPPAENIVKYEMQKSTTLCTLRAVRFHTKKKAIICSDPDSKYAKRVMEILDGRMTAKPTMYYTSTTNTIPAVTTTNETPGKKTETSMSAELQASCCLAVTSTRIPVKDILDYYIQDSLLCPLRAVRFRTTENIIICSDPEDIWAKKAINDVNERRIPTKEPSQEPFETSITNFPTTTTIQRPNTEANTSGPTFRPRLHGNGGIHVTTTTIPVKYILKNLRSRSKKRLQVPSRGLATNAKKLHLKNERMSKLNTQVFTFLTAYTTFL